VGNWRGQSSVVEDDDWRLDAIADVLREERVPFLNARTILREDMRRTSQPLSAYFRAEDGHYSERANRVVASALKDSLAMCRPL
jgi:hypothetical protein